MMIIKRIFNTARTLTEDFSCFEGKINGFVNPYSYMVSNNTLSKDEVPHNILLDGASLVVVMSIFGVRTKRLSFDMTSMAPFVFNHCINDGKSIGFIGGTEKDIESFLSFLAKRYPKLDVLFGISGYNDVYAYKSMISSLRPDVIVLGLGAPLQDQVAKKLYDFYPSTYFTCGGFITQSMTGLDYYPKIINKLHLRFLYRAIREPHFRYRLLEYPRAITMFVCDALKYHKQ